MSISALITPLLGRAVASIDKNGAESRYTITKLSDKLGTMKNGDKAEYVVLTKDGDTGVVINMHPNVAKKLANEQSVDGFSLVMDLAQTAVPAAAAGDAEAEYQAEVAAELAAEQAGAPAAADPAPTAKPKKAKAAKPKKVKAEKPKKVKAEKPVTAKEPSKKDLFMAVYTPNAAAGKTRQEIKTAAESLGLSLAGFNTYYQNCRSGKWV